jgi:DNA-binding NarL/FixJ family response regulator
MRLASDLTVFWLFRGYYSEGRAWLEAFLNAPGSAAHPSALAKALQLAGTLAWYQGESVAARSFHEHSLTLYRTLANAQSNVAVVLDLLGLDACTLGDYADARSFCEEALALARSAGPVWAEIHALYHLGLIACDQMELREAENWHSQSLKLAEDAGELVGIGRAMNGLAEVAHLAGDYARARMLYECDLAKRREFSDLCGVARALAGMGQVLLDVGDLVQARAVLDESVTLSYRIGDRRGIIRALEAFAALAALANQSEEAFRLVGAAMELRSRHQFPLSPASRAQLDRRLEVASQVVNETTATALRSAGRALSVEDAVALARVTGAAASASVIEHAGAASAPERVLTSRELQVALLVGQGLTNRQIAERLVITERTAGAHIEHILHKLGYRTRTQIGVWAAAHDPIALASPFQASTTAGQTRLG